MNTMTPYRRDVLMSIRPVYASKIMSGQKTVELRRKFPEASVGATALIYSTSPVQAIVGYARITSVLRLPIQEIWDKFRKVACIERADFDVYFDGLNYGFAIHLEDVKELDQHLKAVNLREELGFVPPQSFRYVDKGYTSLLGDELQTTDRYQYRDTAGGCSAC